MRWIAFSAFLLIGASLQGCKATAPGKAEIAVMTKAKHAMFIGNKHTRNPIAYSQQSVVDGKEAFSHYCVACHGMDGQNTGRAVCGHDEPARAVAGFAGRAGLLGWPAEVGDRQRYCALRDAGGQRDSQR